MALRGRPGSLPKAKTHLPELETEVPQMELLEQKIGIVFNDKKILKQALTHTSACEKNRSKSNEMLEVLGDSIVQYRVTEKLFDESKNKPDSPIYNCDEGQLCAARAIIVSNANLAKVGTKMNLGKHLFANKEAKKSDKVIADAVEALIGAIQEDQGDDAAKDFVRRYIMEDADTLIKQALQGGGRNRLQELSRKFLGGIDPEYEFLKQSGLDHAIVFEYAVLLPRTAGGAAEEVSRATGTSKKRAMQAAAKQALKTMSWDGL